jgi:hypothetical protein
MLFKIYTYDKNHLQFKKLSLRTYLYLSLTILSMITIGFFGGFIVRDINPPSMYEGQVFVINEHKDDFTEEKFISLLQELNVKYPHIILAQARLETNNFTSKIFRENHNLFGMKQATMRVNTAEGTQHNHAYYESWRASVLDYAFYQCRYLGGIRSEEGYYQYLGQSYAEDGSYVAKLKSMVSKNNLKSLF